MPLASAAQGPVGRDSRSLAGRIAALPSRLPSRLAASFARQRPPLLWHFDADAPLPDGPFIALVPGAEAPLIALTLPSGLRGAAREAVAIRQVLDRLGAAAPDLELRPARLHGQETVWSALLVADRAAVEGWRARIAPARTRCQAILPDYLALPAAPDVWTVQTGPGNAVLVRLGPRDGFAAEGPLAALALTRARAENDPPAAVLRLGPALPEIDTVLEGLPLASTPGDLPERLERPGVLTHGETALDLGTDPRARAAALRARLAALRLPVVLALAGALAWAGGVALETRRAQGQAAALLDETIAAVRRDFLPSGPLLDIPVQVSRELDRRRAMAATPETAPTPLQTLYRAAQVLAGADALLSAVALLPGDEISLEVVLADFATLDRLVARLRGEGLAVRIGRSATEPGGQVAGTLVLATEG